MRVTVTEETIALRDRVSIGRGHHLHRNRQNALTSINKVDSGK